MSKNIRLYLLSTFQTNQVITKTFCDVKKKIPRVCFYSKIPLFLQNVEIFVLLTQNHNKKKFPVQCDFGENTVL